MKTLQVFLGIGIALLMQCTEDISLNLSSAGKILVVNGNISTDSIFQVIQLTQSNAYFSDVNPIPVENASVSVSDEQDTMQFIEDKQTPDLYKSKVAFSGLPGQTYTLNIKNVIIDNVLQPYTYNASSYLYPIPKPDSIQIELVTNAERYRRDTTKTWRIHLFAPNPSSDNEDYMFNLYKNSILVTDTFTKKEISNSFRSSLRGGYINGAVVGRLTASHINENLQIGDTVTVEILGIPSLYSTFYQQVDQQQGGSIPIFSGPPANVITNISPKDRVVGFFVTYSVAKVSRIYGK